MTKNEFIYIKERYVVNNKIINEREVGIILKERGNCVIANFANFGLPIEVPKNVITYFDPIKTGDGFKYKICNVCNRLLDVNSFDKNQNGKNNRTVRRPSCNDCRKVIDGVDVTSREKKEWEKVKPNYEIWQCPICKKKTIPGLTSKVVLDHNHYTGKPRAWICDSCNTGLGRFKDDILLLQSAIDYLKKEV